MKSIWLDLLIVDAVMDTENFEATVSSFQLNEETTLWIEIYHNHVAV